MFYFLERVELAEASKDFGTAFEASVRRRRLNLAAVEAFHAHRRLTAGNLGAWRESLTGDDIKVQVLIEDATENLREAHLRGFRTPHKAYL